MFSMKRCAAVVAVLFAVVQPSVCAAASVWRSLPLYSTSASSLLDSVARSGSQLVELRRSQVPKTTLPLQTQSPSSYSSYADTNFGPQNINLNESPTGLSSTLETTSDLHQGFKSETSLEIPTSHDGRKIEKVISRSPEDNFDEPEAVDELFFKRSEEILETILESEDLASDNAIDDSATRATLLWRAMVARFPAVASKAAMHWRILAASDPTAAARAAMAARKMIAEDPEQMARAAISPLLPGLNRKQSSTASEIRHKRASLSSSLPPYWLEFAAHDPEVTARSALFWLNDERANMYW